jgi:hypothetical protein
MNLFTFLLSTILNQCLLRQITFLSAFKPEMWKEILSPRLALVSVGAVPVDQSLEAITETKEICRLQTMLQKWLGWGGDSDQDRRHSIRVFFKSIC